MKKVLTSLATVVLMTGSVATVGSELKHHPQQKVGLGYQNQQTREHNIFQATNEDAEDIANKLWNQTIKTRTKFWFNKDIKDYQTQFNAQIVKQGILTATEAKYVTWGSFKIAQAFHYYGKTPFTVTKDGAVCTGHVNLDAHADQQHLIEKLTNNTLQFNYDYWNGKTVNDELPLLRSMFANEGILTPAQASDIIGLTAPIKMPHWNIKCKT